jgi:hypothetical protein
VTGPGSALAQPGTGWGGPVCPYRSELFRRLWAEGYARGYAKGVAKGEAISVLVVLDERDIAVPAATRARILSCLHLDTLFRWRARAIIAESVEDLFVPDPSGMTG